MKQSELYARMPGSPVTLMYRVYKFVLPEVRAELARLHSLAEGIPDQELRTQALASIQSKQFHCEGGGVYAAANLEQRHVLIPLIVALQTISDYLDNLCDRSTSLDPNDFRQLHYALEDAVHPKAPLRNYYAERVEQDDGGYLHELVRTCQHSIRMLPGYANAQPFVAELVGLYSDLQVYKHIRQELREPQLLAWWEEHRTRCSHLKWNEFAAATGSTLGMFMLFLTATAEDLSTEDARVVRDAYFPHLCGLHIMLDYLIDQDEDRLGGDLNFCNYYEGQHQLIERVGEIVEQARRDIRLLPGWRFHRMIIEGLLALYLSDPKVRDQTGVRRVRKQLMRNSPITRLFFWGNSVWIRTHKQS